LSLVHQFLTKSFSGSFGRDVLGVGHRVVHGGTIGEATLIE
jgi:acetate kinase